MQEASILVYLPLQKAWSYLLKNYICLNKKTIDADEMADYTQKAENKKDPGSDDWTFSKCIILIHSYLKDRFPRSFSLYSSFLSHILHTIELISWKQNKMKGGKIS